MNPEISLQQNYIFVVGTAFSLNLIETIDWNIPYFKVWQRIIFFRTFTRWKKRVLKCDSMIITLWHFTISILDSQPLSKWNQKQGNQLQRGRERDRRHIHWELGIRERMESLLQSPKMHFTKYFFMQSKITTQTMGTTLLNRRNQEFFSPYLSLDAGEFRMQKLFCFQQFEKICHLLW